MTIFLWIINIFFIFQVLKAIRLIIKSYDNCSSLIKDDRYIGMLAIVVSMIFILPISGGLFVIYYELQNTTSSMVILLICSFPLIFVILSAVFIIMKSKYKLDK